MLVVVLSIKVSIYGKGKLSFELAQFKSLCEYRSEERRVGKEC